MQQLQLHFMKTFNIHNSTTITFHEKHLIYTIQLQLQFMKNNSITMQLHEKHLIYTMQLQLQFMKNI